MNNLTAYDPFVESGIDELFRGFFRPVRVEKAPATIKMDVAEQDNAYIVKAEIPGVAKEDIQVSIEGNQVTIGAEVKREKDVKDGERILRSERYYGSVYRGFTLPVEVDETDQQRQVRERRARAHARQEARQRGPQAHDPVIARGIDRSGIPRAPLRNASASTSRPQDPAVASSASIPFPQVRAVAASASQRRLAPSHPHSLRSGAPAPGSRRDSRLLAPFGPRRSRPRPPHRFHEIPWARCRPRASTRDCSRPSGLAARAASGFASRDTPRRCCRGRSSTATTPTGGAGACRRTRRRTRRFPTRAPPRACASRAS